MSSTIIDILNAISPVEKNSRGTMNTLGKFITVLCLNVLLTFLLKSGCLCENLPSSQHFYPKYFQSSPDLNITLDHKEIFTHGDSIVIKFSINGQNQSETRCSSWDWIALFANQTCIETHKCYHTYEYVGAKQSCINGYVSFRSSELSVGSFDIRYFQRDSFFSNSIVRARSSFLLTNSEGTVFTSPTLYCLSFINRLIGYDIQILSNNRSNPGDEVMIKWSAQGMHDSSDFIGLFEKGTCTLHNNCYITSKSIPGLQLSGKLIYKLPMDGDNKIYEFRYITSFVKAIAISGPIFVKQEKEIQQLSGNDSYSDTLGRGDNKYVFGVNGILTNDAQFTAVVAKNSSVCPVNLTLLIKHGEVPYHDIYDFKATTKGDNPVVATFSLDSSTSGKWYFVVSADPRDESHSHTNCSYHLNFKYVIRCPNDCSLRGLCNNGTCNCSVGYSGIDCSKGLTPFNPSSHPKRPLLLLPGIGGTVLDFVSETQSESLHSWVNIENIIAGMGWKSRNRAFIEAMMPVYNQSTDRLDPLKYGLQGRIIPNSKYFGLEGISCLLSEKAKWYIEALHLTSYIKGAYYYQSLVQWLLDDVGYIPGKNLFGFGYDWRMSSQHGDTVEPLRYTIRNLYHLNNTPIDVFTHSMGGLVMRSYIAKYPEEAARFIRSWTVAGTPFHGSPKAIDAYISGYNFDNPLIQENDAMNFALDTPSIYELFVDSHANFSRGEPTLSFKFVDGKTMRHPLGSVSNILSKVFEGNVFIDMNGNQYSRPYREILYHNSERSRALWREVKLPRSIKFFNLYGDSIPTIFDLNYEKPISSYPELKGANGTYSFTAGDKTVPVESAYFDGFEAEARIGFQGVDHVGLVKDERIFKWIRDITMNKCVIHGWWNSPEFVGAYFFISQIGRSIHFKASMSHFPVEFSGYYEGGLVIGQVLHSNKEFVLNISRDCLSMNAIVRVQDKIVMEFSAERSIGPFCAPGSFLPCPIQNGTGMRRCNYGYFSSICEISSCNFGYCPSEDETHDHLASCLPCESQQGDPQALANNFGLCPSDRPYDCNGGCTNDIHACTRTIAYHNECEADKPFYCDGICWEFLRDCPSMKHRFHSRGEAGFSEHIKFSKCSKERPYLCLDGISCEKTSSDCGVGSEKNPHCPANFPVLCPDMKCVRNFSNCEGEIQEYELKKKFCPAEKSFRCSDGTCQQNLELCAAKRLKSGQFNINGLWEFFRIDSISSNLHIIITGNVDVYMKREHLPSWTSYDLFSTPIDGISVLTLCFDETNKSNRNQNMIIGIHNNIHSPDSIHSQNIHIQVIEKRGPCKSSLLLLAQSSLHNPILIIIGTIFMIIIIIFLLFIFFRFSTFIFHQWRRIKYQSIY